MTISRVPSLWRWLPIALASFLLAGYGVLALTNPPSPRPDSHFAYAEQMIGAFLAQYHYRNQPLDDTLSRQVYTAYFTALDPQRYYFLASDLARYSQYRTRLDDLLREGEITPAFDIFDVYRQRVKERSQFAVTELAKPFEFTTDETFDLDRSKAPWAADEARLDRIWRKRVKNDALTLKLTGKDAAEIRSTLRDRYQRMARSVAQFHEEDVFQIYMNAWAGAFDPHSSYLSPRSSENFDINMSLSLEGVGALLRSEGDHTEVVELIPGGPAAKSGQLAPGDKIIGVGQNKGTIQDVVGWRLGDVVELIRGPAATTVRLQVLPAKGGANATPKVVQLVRNRIQLKEQAAQSERLPIPHNDREYHIGVIKIPAFYIDFQAARLGGKDYRSTTRDVHKLLNELVQQGIDGLVIDLRGNAGGSLQEATKTTGLFIEDGPVVQVRRRTGEREVLRDNDGHTVAYQGPLVVMVDRFSASASEIFAAAIQDYGRGLIIGDQTFGKGTVQSMIDLGRLELDEQDSPGGRLKLTIAKFYRITGESTQRVGVKPDIALPAVTNDNRVGEMAEPFALPWDRIAPVRFQPAGDVQRWLASLEKQHAVRMATDPGLQAVTDEYRQLRTQRARTEVSLNEKIRRQQREHSEQTRLAAINQLLRASDQPSIQSLDEIDEDELPDTLLKEAARIATDMRVLRAQTPRSNWSQANFN
ncbi:carboxy terminal-processing peptidase [Nitrococcus mobilis]|uniref:Periplasmic tail-specific protease n=1 Tax=Nitrococcus mobilis Nb-231 TaxID=314278 RepID=A4BS60_9GAMM|nr:carboxy terminal-processing peptidase [Nitrococcus mobilis]EAR21539.1 periplasmic tail-specific protease [Nitrococcus mobilis Nb-231]